MDTNNNIPMTVWAINKRQLARSSAPNLHFDRGPWLELVVHEQLGHCFAEQGWVSLRCLEAFATRHKTLSATSTEVVVRKRCVLRFEILRQWLLQVADPRHVGVQLQCFPGP
jgi:hypothetical protein